MQEIITVDLDISSKESIKECYKTLLSCQYKDSVVIIKTPSKKEGLYLNDKWKQLVAIQLLELHLQETAKVESK